MVIRRSFVILDRVSRKTEQNIWAQGIPDWTGFLKAEQVRGIARKRKPFLERQLREAERALKDDNSVFFAENLPSREIWRIYDYFKEQCCFLDIEIDQWNRITVVGISDYFHTNFFVRGVNLERPLLEKELGKYKLLVTFNGSAFDLPRLRKEFSLNISIPHLDLKPLCVNLGLKGGLKEIEKTLNLKRPAHLYGNPVELWQAFHASGDKEYLELLLEYNREDCENLKAIAGKVCRETATKYINSPALPLLNEKS